MNIDIGNGTIAAITTIIDSTSTTTSTSTTNNTNTNTTSIATSTATSTSTNADTCTPGGHVGDLTAGVG